MLELIEALRVVCPQAEAIELREACKRLFLDSDLQFMSEVPFAIDEVGVISDAMFKMIAEPPDSTFREMKFNSRRPLLGNSMEFWSFAEMFSEDILIQMYTVRFADLTREQLEFKLPMFLVAIFFRYRWCSYSDTHFFPVSIILQYIEATRMLYPKDQQVVRMQSALELTLEALKFLENES